MSVAEQEPVTKTEGAKRPSHWFSWSQLSLYAECGERYRLEYVERVRKPRPNTYFALGRAVHASVAANLQKIIDTAGEEWLTEEEVCDVASSRANTEADAGILLDEKEQDAGIVWTRGSLVDRSVSLSRAHWGGVAPELEPLAVEHRFEVHLPGYDTALVGVLDVVESGKIRDTKTANRAPTKADVITTPQLTIYALAARAKWGRVPDAIHLDYLIARERRKGGEAYYEYEVQLLQGERTEEDFAGIFARVETLIKAREHGVFMPRDPHDWKCRGCPFFGRECRYTQRFPTIVKLSTEL